MFSAMAAQLLRPEFEVVTVVHDGRALIAAAAMTPDVAVIDVYLPLIGGETAVREVLRVSPSTKVVILTMNDDPNVAADVLAAGASGYLLKTSPPDELATGIREVLRGNTFITPAIAVKLESIDRQPSRALTARERQVANLVGEGKSMREIATILRVTPRTVAFHKYRVMRKLGVRSSAELIRTVLWRAMAR